MKKNMNKEKRKYLNDYISVARNDIIIRVVFFALVIFLFLISNIYIDNLFKFFIIFVLFLRTSHFVIVYLHLLYIKKFLVKNNINVNNLKIILWNETNAIFTEEYVIVFQKLRVELISYNDIEKIKEAIHYFAHGTGKDLILTLKNGETYKFLIEWGPFCEIDCNKLYQFIINKNKKIILIN